jgi:carbon dioxide concentrating mechanism protein CcmK
VSDGEVARSREHLAAGILEAEGFVPIFDAAEAMTKATEIEVGGMVSLGSGLVAVTVRGSLAHVAEAVRIAERTIHHDHGLASRSIVIARPCAIVSALADQPSIIG